MKKKFKFLLIIFLLLGVAAGSVAAEEKMSLREAQELALDQSDQVQISREEISQAQAQQTMVASGLWPQVNLHSRAIRQEEIEAQGGASGTPETDYAYGVELNQYLFQGGRRLFETSAAARRLESARAGDYRQCQQVLFNVAESYIRVLLARRNIEIAETVLQRAESQLERARGRFEVGEITRTGVLRAEVQKARAEEELQRAKNSKEIARDQLALAIGVEELERKIEEINKELPEDRPLENYHQLAQGNREDLEALQKVQEASEQRLNAKKAEYSPEFNLRASYDYEDEGMIGDEEDFWQVMLQASYPLFSGWRHTAEVREAESQLRQSDARREELRKQVQIEVRSSYLEVQTEKKVILAAEDQVRAARQNYEEIVAQFEEGLATALDVSDAHDALAEAERSLAASYHQQQLNIMRLELAAGIYQQELLEEQ